MFMILNYSAWISIWRYYVSIKVAGDWYKTQYIPLLLAALAGAVLGSKNLFCHMSYSQDEEMAPAAAEEAAETVAPTNTSEPLKELEEDAKKDPASSVIGLGEGRLKW